MKKTFLSEGLVKCGFMAVLAAVAAQAEEGFKFNNLTVSPYVNLEYKYDSNVDNDRREFGDSILHVTPGVDLKYEGNDWGISADLFYGYSKYMKYDELDARRWGERVKAWWESEKGWNLVLGESYVQSKDSDSIIDGGRGLWRDREQLQFTGALAYKTERNRITVDAAYTDIDYHNDPKRYRQLYGWSRWSAGLEFARRLTDKTNFLLGGDIGQYSSDGAKHNGYKNESSFYSLQAGIGSRATEKITYRLMTGVSWFDYGNDDLTTGWIYTADVNWIINKKLAMTLVGSSYYQPSESVANQATKIYMLAAGLTYRPYKKLTGRFDLAWRREEEIRSSDYDEDLISARVRADYRFAKYMSVYAGFQYDKRFSQSSYYEYDRYLGLVGLRLSY
ncbi:MAG: outer membrane beta-barrel protein [Kiritimatiellae bacterium]|nr:outer membrane beta-barrel protein [Kiritimatiellia bacterium]